jgi:hypothetical protein
MIVTVLVTILVSLGLGRAVAAMNERAEHPADRVPVGAAERGVAGGIGAAPGAVTQEEAGVVPVMVVPLARASRALELHHATRAFSGAGLLERGLTEELDCLSGRHGIADRRAIRR